MVSDAWIYVPVDVCANYWYRGFAMGESDDEITRGYG